MDKPKPGWSPLAIALIAGAVFVPADLSSQSLAQQVSRVADGTVRLTFPTRPDVLICDQGIKLGEHQMMWHSRDWGEEPANCRPGPAEIEIEVQGGSVRGIEVVRRVQDRTEGGTDLGSVSAQQAVDFLLDAARTGGQSGRGEEDAVFPAVLADIEAIWEDLLVIARESGVKKDVRTSALFWVGQEAANVVTEGLAEVALDEEEDQEVREAAVFALSRRPADEGVPILMQVARNAKVAGTRRSAMFWLAQSEDERVFAFFEEVLLGRGGD
jgi:hypothetical protein